MLKVSLIVSAAAFVVLVSIYALWLRPWLLGQAWAKPFFDTVEPVERALFKKSETILFARLKMAVGVILAVLTSLGAIDITPLLPLIPDRYEAAIRVAINLLPLLITLVGLVDEKLRRDTTLPLAIVATPADHVTPEVKAAIADVVEANTTAVETVKAVAAEKAS